MTNSPNPYPIRPEIDPRAESALPVILEGSVRKHETLPPEGRNRTGGLLQALLMEAANIKQAIRQQNDHLGDDPDAFKTSGLIQIPRFEPLPDAAELNAELDRRQPNRNTGMKAIHNAVIQNEIEKEKARRQAIQMEAVDQQMARLARAIVETAEAQKMQQARSFHRQQATAFDTIPGIIPGSLARHGIGQTNIRPLIAESLPIVHAIPGAQKPISRADYLRQQNALAMERAQRDALYAQQRYYEEQTRQERVRRNVEYQQRLRTGNQQQALAQPVKVFPQAQSSSPVPGSYAEALKTLDALTDKIDQVIESLLEAIPLPPQQAYQMVQAGHLSQVRTKRVSLWYNWGDILKAPHVTAGNAKTIPLSAYENAVDLAEALDRVCNNLGSKAPINNWIRPGNRRYHGQGLAVDFEGTKAWKDGPLYTALRRTPEIKRIGQPDNNYPGMHADIGPNGWVPGRQFLFIDNGYYKPGRDYTVPVFTGPQSARLRPGT